MRKTTCKNNYFNTEYWSNVGLFEYSNFQVVEGLNFMKEQMNLIYRDVKPSNILLNKQGAVKILRFRYFGTFDQLGWFSLNAFIISRSLFIPTLLCLLA